MFEYLGTLSAVKWGENATYPNQKITTEKAFVQLSWIKHVLLIQKCWPFLSGDFDTAILNLRVGPERCSRLMLLKIND
jgi:hypothetical protein